MVTEPHSLTVRPYAAETDYPLVNDWWQARHGAMEDLPAGMLPPLGVVVVDAQGPCFALWCYEAAGVGVATLEYPVGRPGRTIAEVREAFTVAATSIIHLAGNCWNPPGQFTVFRANVSISMLRAIEGLGFQREYHEERIPVILNLSPDAT